MALDHNIKKNWELKQQKFNYPVNALGVKIKPTDAATIRIWKEEGIDKCMRQ